MVAWDTKNMSQEQTPPFGVANFVRDADGWSTDDSTIAGIRLWAPRAKELIQGLESLAEISGVTFSVSYAEGVEKQVQKGLL